MNKRIIKRFVCGIFTAVVALSVSYIGAIATLADNIVAGSAETVPVLETAAQGSGSMKEVLDRDSTPYTYGTKVGGNLSIIVSDNRYSFVLTSKATVTVNVSAAFTTDSAIMRWGLVNTDGMNIFESRVNAVSGSAENGLKRNPADGKAEANVIYENLSAGTYYFSVFVGYDDKGRFSDGANGAPFALAITSETFKAGAVVSGVSAHLNAGTGAINVNWGKLPASRYAVYYIYQDKISGAFGNWGVVSADTAAYTILSPVKNATYYITILPFGDNPRVYGGFSPYKTVVT